MMRYVMGMLWAVALVPAFSAADTVCLPAVQDNSIVMVDGEWSVNAGGASRLRIKGNQHMVAMAFDLAALRGNRVTAATLVCHAAAETIQGITISTIAAPWDEVRSTGLTAGRPGIEGWGYAGARFPAVAGGNAETLVHQVETLPEDGVYRWEVPPDMVHAMATGVAFGLALHEHDADYGRNPTIFSREQSGKQPVLIVEVDDRQTETPGPAVEGRLVGGDGRSAKLILRAPPQGFAYEVTVDGVCVPQHNVPLVVPGTEQTIHLRDLPAAITRPGQHEVRVVTLSRSGERSEPVVLRGDLFGEEPVTVPAVRPPSAAEPAIEGLSVIPVTDKYDLQGRPVGALPAGYRSSNAIFDGRQIRLTAAAGEVLGFQVLLRGQGGVAVACDLDRVGWRTDLFQARYVPAEGRQIPDPLVPCPATLPLSIDKDQAVFVDVYVPFDATPGEVAGALTVSDGRTVPIRVTVLPIALPRKATFLCEMNSYGLPDRVDDFYALQQVAYDHRVHANILYYSHHTAAPGARKTNLDMRLRSGRRMDNRRYDAIEPGATTAFWDDFVEAFGPYLDGSCFREGHRGAIPAPGFYLAFHESWPLNCRAFFNGDPDAYRAVAQNPRYARTYVNVLRDFVRVAKANGWSETGFQVYFNNKGSLTEESKSPWILDEPTSFWDYHALQFYGELTDQGRQGSDGVQVDYRIDISRPEYCRGQLNGRSDLWVVSSSAFQHYRRLVTDRMDRDNLSVWVYGTTNPVHETNRQVLAWAVDAWRHGAEGLVPWQTVDKTGQALTTADQLGLVIFDTAPDGQTAIRHSTRLKAYREAEQLVEMLVLVQQQQGWSRSQMRAFVEQAVTLSGDVRKANDADAGTSLYEPAHLVGLDALRQAAIEVLLAR